MQLFADYFSDKSIIWELCKHRAKSAHKTSGRLFLQRIRRDLPEGKSPGNPSGKTDYTSIFPPRRKWHSFRPKRRWGKSSVDLNKEALFNAVITLRIRTPQEPWVKRLRDRIETIRSRVISTRPFIFSTPRIHAVEKDRAKKLYRPLAEFKDDDKIIDCLVARYFRDRLDSALSPTCLAFRCLKESKKPRGINAALEKLLAINRRNRKRGLYVAECDIQGFYDCVSHKVAREALNDLIKDAQKNTTTLTIDNRALEVFDAFLRAYSFPREVRGTALKKLREKDSQRNIRWPDAELSKLHKGKILENIGVPQGGAISCLIANAVLHSADKGLARLKRVLGKSFTYLRYCDDMILLARDREVCAKAFSHYCRVVKGLLLPIHKPAPIKRYSKSFYGGKSNKPYHWCKPKGGRGVPWIQFVGFQVRHDGLVRVRLKSLQKQFEKQREAANELLRTPNPKRRKSNGLPLFADGLRKNAKEIEHRFRQRLISIAVGRRNLVQSLDELMPMCWTHGFSGLKNRNIVLSQMRALDRHRENQIRRVKGLLKLLPPKSPSARKKRGKGFCRFYGHPFSYCGQFAKTNRPANR